MLWSILAEGANDVSVTQWFQMGSGVFGSGFAVWYAWYTTTKTLPTLNQQHNELVGKIVDDFRSESKEQRESEKERTKAIAASMSAISESVHELTDKIGSHIHK